MRNRAVVGLFAAVLVGGCGGGDRAGRSALSVYAASSLTEAFGEMETLFEEAHPEADVAITFAGSQILRLQIEEGAPADVFASAHPQHVSALTDAGLMTEGRVFARNELVVIVPLDNPTHLETFAELPDVGRLVLGTTEAPVGRYARQMLAAADSIVRPGFQDDVLERVVSEESNVRLARSKVELAEADAAIVYRTDAASSSQVRMIEIPARVNVQADYIIGLVGRQGRSTLAQEWVEMVVSSQGRAVLTRHGFLIP